jgi:hypothetical protein
VANVANLIQFKPGQSGNPGGRAVNARNRITAKFLNDLADDYEEHGVDVIRQVREDKPERYLMIVASLLPTKVDLTATPLSDLSDEDLTKKLELLDVLHQAIEAQRADQP